MTSPANLVREFHEAFGVPVHDTKTPDLVQDRVALRWSLIDEEATELHTAIFQDGDIVETADALADLVYVIYGAALEFGIDLDAVLAEVHRSNMSKLDTDGKPIYREDGKVLKSSHFVLPDIKRVLDLDD